MFGLIAKLIRLLFSLPFLLLILVGFVVWNSNLLTKKVVENEQPQNEEQQEEEENEQLGEPATLVYEEEPAYEGAHFFQKFELIEDQWAYIAFPLEINLDDPPVLVVYSHGSITNITNDPSDPFMKDMIAYGKYFTKRGYAFAASNEHGANWGSDEALADMTNMIAWVREKYTIEKKVNLLAHSMGGLPTLYFAFSYPKRVDRIALLAPTTYVWGEDKYDALSNIPVKIWHGDSDVNIPWSVSKGFVDRGATYGKEIELRTVVGGTHWDVDTEMKDEILTFFNE